MVMPHDSFLSYLQQFINGHANKIKTWEKNSSCFWETDDGVLVVVFDLSSSAEGLIRPKSGCRYNEVEIPLAVPAKTDDWRQRMARVALKLGSRLRCPLMMQTNDMKMFKTPAMVLDCDTVINDHHRHS